MTSTVTNGVRAVSVPVADQDRALDFYVGTLGFTKIRDVPTPAGGRWIELSPGGGDTVITLEPNSSDKPSAAVGIRFSTPDAEAAHSAMRTAGVDVDEILNWPGVPPMFAFRDPDGNGFSITEIP
jgi:catechol 2,3-dioxygenase-like lactoylglutathione lyase family enzyme